VAAAIAQRTKHVTLEHEGKRPNIAVSVRIASNAVVCGDVVIGENCSIGFGAVLTAESGAIAIGRNCVVMDTAVLRSVRCNPLTPGNNILVGPRAYLSGCTIEDDVFLATGSTVFNGARIGRRAEVRINGIVHIRTVVGEDAVVPLGWIAVGDPARILPPEKHDEIWNVQRALDFPKYVFGVERPREAGSAMSQIISRYAEALRRRHK
jgi:carbonic anhydrase/acetyltransferase-like protein (isoleucine patch superfamily)